MQSAILPRNLDFFYWKIGIENQGQLQGVLFDSVIASRFSEVTGKENTYVYNHPGIYTYLCITLYVISHILIILNYTICNNHLQSHESF